MELPVLRQVPNRVESRTETIGFKGLNRMPVVNSGELSSMTNLSSRYAPCLYPRDPRELVNSLTAGSALFTANGVLCWVDGTDFVYNGVVKGAVTAGPKSIDEYFGIILIFPDKKYYNYVTDTFDSISDCPDIDYICVHNNRAFGVGGNGFYASKLGDPLVWDKFSVPLEESDSWQSNTAEEGDFTGITVFQNQVIATKEGYLYELLGNKPSNFKIHRIAKSGCIDNKSLVEINGMLFMLGNEGVKIYSGAFPDVISLNLNETYVSGTAGTDGRRYYISLYNGTEYNLYVFDTETGLWHREDESNVTDFTVLENSLYALSGNGIYKFNSGDETVAWEAETERFTERYMGAKINSKIKITAELEEGSTLNVYYSIDDGDYILAESVDHITGFKLFTTYISLERANTFKIKLTGTGKVKIFDMLREMTLGSDVVENAFIYTWDMLEPYTFTGMESFTFTRLNRAEA